MGKKNRRSRLQEGPAEATIESLSHEGRGIATINGKKVFIHGALPGETVSFRYTFSKKSHAEGITESIILNPSPDRATPKCTFYDICGGCQLQHMTIEKQLSLKENTLLEQLQHFGELSPEILLPPLTGEPYSYRRKARLGARYVIKKERVLVGFRERNGRYIADMDQCEILDPRIGLKIKALANLIETLSCPRELPQIEVAISDKVCALILRHLVPLTADDLMKLSHFSSDENITFYLQPGGPDTITSLHPEDNTLLSYELSHFNITLDFHPSDFVQVNHEMNQALVKQAVKLLDPQPEETILDLFCGLGNFSLPIATRCKKVVGIEGDKKMVARATQNAKKNFLSNTEFFTADLSQNFLGQDFAKIHFDKLFIDPPRCGAPAVIEQIPHFNPSLIVYVSCNPATLARDAKEIVQSHGYTLKSAGIINMFPHTGHVESIAIFEKKKRGKDGKS
jgi:23S rRNA (uracil1939-C5)-methyltransferase